MSAGLDLANLPDAHAVALIFATDPHGFGGIVLRGRPGPARDRCLATIRGLLPVDAPWRRLPPGTADERLDGDLDLAATLSMGRPSRQPGLLAASHHGVLVIPMAERLPMVMAARLGMALDTGRTADGSAPARLGIVALDEGLDEEAAPAKLVERMTFHLTLADDDPGPRLDLDREAVADAGRRSPGIVLPDGVMRALAETALAFGIVSLRPVLMSARAARAVAALCGRDTVTGDDAEVAAKLVLAPRATEIPTSGEQQPAEAPAEDERDGSQEGRAEERAGGALPESLQEAVKSALPPGLLLQLSGEGRTARQAPGRAGATQAAANRGRPAGLRRGVPRGGARLNLIETLRAAAPWQSFRRAVAPDAAGRRVVIRRDDLRLTRFKQRTETVTLFAVDASGSLAHRRLNEAKAAAELLLAECYVRRDQVALLTFRGTGVELLLPPTRSLARAKRCLANLVGGGPTPLATALDEAMTLVDGIRRRGRTPILVLFTDGAANVTRDGAVDRPRAQAEAQEAARAAAHSGLRILLIDAAPRPQAAARALAGTMGATYLALPRAEATGLTQAIRRAATDRP